MNKLLGIAIIVGAPLLLWFDVWLAFQFGFWVVDLSGSDEAGFMLGFMAICLLPVSQALGVMAFVNGVE